jgi:hypothetical protein
MTSKLLLTGVAAMALFASPALASDRDRALLAIGQAQSTIQLASSAGAEAWAGDVQAQSNLALERARRQLSKGKERRAFYAAREADAYARLALAKAQTHSLATPAKF